jgi:hypothetical protein
MPYVTPSQPRPTPRPQAQKDPQGNNQPPPSKPIFSDWAMI